MTSFVKTVRYDRWDDFKSDLVRELFGNEAFTRGRYLFRGQRDATWALDTSFDRAYAKLTGADRPRVAAELLNAFRDALSDHNLLEDVTGSELVAVAQHHGLPTRLLDWSESPYMAAYFAFSGALMANCLECEVAIWILDASRPIWNEQMGVTIVSVTSRGNVRLRNQYGKFTLSNTPFRTLDEYVAFCKDDRALRKIVMPAGEAMKALGDLDVMGINPSRLFPDISGCARNARITVALMSQRTAETKK